MRTKKVRLNRQSSSETKVANKFPIVGIGASAGGLEPITKLLGHLPIQTGLSFVVIQHLAAGQESMLPEILSRSTKMKVKQAADGMRIEKDHVYVIPPGTTLTLKNNVIKLLPKKPLFKPINDFLVSLASEQRTQAIGIVLSGTGNDGTEGLKAVKAEGGITFAQNPDTAQYPDMPKNAIAAGTPDFVLSPEQIANELSRIAKFPQLIPIETKMPEQEKVETEMKKILTVLKSSFGVDFSHYRETTINRRITRRMVINKTDNIKAYVEYLPAHPNEQQALFDDMLIGVTSFFREPNTFTALKEKVFPELVKNRSSDESIRVWVPGCSTGEDVYSLAITIQEFLEEKGLTNVRIQIFGTDANEKNIEKSRQGTYPKSIEGKVSENRLKRFFTSDNGHHRITKPIRDMCIFAKQDITTDPPFSNIDLIMCRNVLIYFDEYLHQKVLPIFHYGLKPNGFLVLGESESIGKFQNLFESIIPKGLVYRKRQAVQPAMFGEDAFTPYAAKKTAKPLEKKDMLTVLGSQVDRLIMTEYGPATLLVNSSLDILVFRGDVAPYLSPESGAASLNLTKIIRKELRSQVQTAVYRAKKENRIFKETVHYKQKGQSKTVNIEIRPLKAVEFTEPFYIVLFAEAVSQNQPEVFESALLPAEMENLKDRQIRELREDLDATKQSLQTLVEGQEATNEELRSSMEEVQSSNEELQSTNEELETAKEELQSGNEELQTLNEELKNRNQALGRLNDDLANLQTNIDIALVIVDSSLRIRRFTAAAQELLRILPSDIGGSITNITPGVHVQDLDKVITDVIDKLTPVSQEVEGLEGHFYEMRIRPYLTEDKKIDGAFLSFTDITKRKKAEAKTHWQNVILEGVNKILEGAFSARTEKDLGQICLNVAEKLTQSKFGFIGELNPKGLEDISISNPGWDACKVTDLGGHRSPPGSFAVHGIYGRVLKDGKALISNDPATHPDRIGLPVGHPQLRAFLGVPLKREGKTIGLLAVGNREGGYANDQLESLEALGPAIVEAFLRKRAEHSLEEYRINLEKLVDERTRQLKDSERLAAIGATAGMVGHDIRNPLQVITSDVYLAKTDLKSIPESAEKKNALESLGEIGKNVDYINKIVADLQDFARPLTPKLEETDLEKIVYSVIASLNIPENIKVTYSIRKDFPKLKTDQSYIQRILTNLTNNAIQAMPNGGKLTITAFSKNGKATITVQDTGEGIPEKVRNKIFSPLVTTKAKGQGFGLPVVKKFTEALGGTVTFESEVGKGTKFKIEFPA